MSRISHDKVQELLSASKRALEDYKDPLEFLSDLYEMLKETRLNSWDLLKKSEGEIREYISARLEQPFCEEEDEDEDEDDEEEEDEEEEDECTCDNYCDEIRCKESEEYEVYLQTRGNKDVCKIQCCHVFTRGTFYGQKCERPASNLGLTLGGDLPKCIEHLKEEETRIMRSLDRREEVLNAFTPVFVPQFPDSQIQPAHGQVIWPVPQFQCCNWFDNGHGVKVRCGGDRDLCSLYTCFICAMCLEPKYVNIQQ